MKQRVSEVVTIDEIKKWHEGDIITIKAGTGVGKSYFIKNNLYAFAKANKKKILILIHRTNCIEQFKAEIYKDHKSNVIDIMSYQKIEALYKHNKSFNFDIYDYVISDEFHYYMSDAAFNITTDISFNAIIGQSNVVKIFMSATGDYMKTYINNRKKISTIDYELPITYDFIKNLTFFTKDETMEKFIEEAIDKKDKGIFFIQSAEKAYDLYKKYEDHCLFNCSKNNDKYYKYVDSDKINEMLKNEKFEEQFLITTTCLDAGVNIKDDEVKHIVIDNKDLGSLIQCMGRKRLKDNNDKIYVYIKGINNRQLGGMETQLKKKIKMADYLMKHTVKEFIEEYPRQYDHNNIVYNDTVNEVDKGTLKVNDLMYAKCNTNLCDIEFMKLRGEFGYYKYLAHMFGFQDTETGKYKYRTIEENWRALEVEEYLESIIGQQIYKDKQKEIVEIIGLKDARGRLQKSIGQLNEYLKANKIKYMLINKKDNRKKLDNDKDNPNRGKHYWEVVKIIIE
jgi:superfamily II DNA or RNA helicase